MTTKEFLEFEKDMILKIFNKDHMILCPDHGSI
jgi:hypothetical protein